MSIENTKRDPDLETEADEGADPEASGAYAIKISGPTYEGKIDAEVAGVILDVQTAIYSVARSVYFGEEGSRRRLPQDSKHRLSVQFTIKPGCTEIIGDLLPAFVEIAKAWGENMEPDQLASVAKTLICIFGGAPVGITLIKQVSAYFTKKAEIAGETNAESLRNQHDRDLIAYGVDAAKRAGEEVAVKIAKRLPYATELSVGSRKFSDADLDEIRGRSPRSRPEESFVKGKFFVCEIDLSRRPVVHVSLKGDDGKTFRGTYTERQDGEEGIFETEPDSTAKILCDAAWQGAAVAVHFVQKKNANGEFIDATIVSVQPLTSVGQYGPK